MTRGVDATEAAPHAVDAQGGQREAMAEVKPPRPRNVLVAEFPGLSKDDASQALRDAGGDLNKARKLVKKRRGDDVSDSDDDVVIGDTIASDAALAIPKGCLKRSSRPPDNEKTENVRNV